MNIYNFLTDKGKRRYARVDPIECLYLKKDVNSIFIVLYRRVMRSSFGSESLAFIIVETGTKTIKLDFWEVVLKVFYG